MSIEIPRHLANTLSKGKPTPEVAVAVEALAGPLAHHLNNSLGIILGYTEVVMSSFPNNHPHVADLMEARSAAWKCAELAEQMLTFAGRHHVEPVDVDPFAVTARHVREHHDGVHYFAGEGRGRIHMDEARLRRLLDILVDNALDAIEPGGFVGVQTCATNETVEITVLDDGCGVPSDLAPRIFDPLTTSNLACHTGMGLAEAFGIVTRAGGTIAFGTRPAHGAVFRVSLPSAYKTSCS